MDSKKLKSDLSLFKLFWLFMIGSVGGIIVEGVWCIIKNGHWVTHSATVWGPFCIIYGIGLVAMYIAACFLEKSDLFTKFVSFTILGALVEYCGSLFQEVFFGSTSWNYSSHPFNLGGRISLDMAVIWGILGIVFMKLIYPLLAPLFKKLNNRPIQILTIFLAIFMVINLIVTSIAVKRWSDRIHDVPAKNDVEVYFDEHYDNVRMRKTFKNMKFDK